MDISLNERIAFVTGASSGIGTAIARGLARSGAAVVLAARRVDKLRDLSYAIQAEGGRALAVALDVSDRASVKAAFDRAEQELGTPDIIINNAGIAEVGNFLSISEESRDRVMRTNFDGVWNVGQESAGRMVRANRKGSIINIASILGSGVQHGYSAYTASKGAVLQLTRNMAVDLIRKGIRVNGIAPGWFRTEMNQDYFDSPKGQAYVQSLPSQRLGRLDELVGPVIFLASDAASFVNGTILPVDGGHHSWLP